MRQIDNLQFNYGSTILFVAFLKLFLQGPQGDPGAPGPVGTPGTQVTAFLTRRESILFLEFHVNRYSCIFIQIFDIAGRNYVYVCNYDIVS